MTTLPATEPRLLLVTPSGWWRIPLQDEGARTGSIRALVRRQFAGLDDQPLLRAQTEEQLAGAARSAAEQGGLEMYVSTDAVAGFPIAASLVVSMLPVEGAGAAALSSLAEELRADGSEVAMVELAGSGRVLRRRRTALPSAARNLGADSDSVVVDFYLPAPRRSGLALLNFATPLLTLAEPMAELFEAIASTARWDTDDRPAGTAPRAEGGEGAEQVGGLGLTGPVAFQEGRPWRIELPEASWLRLPLDVAADDIPAWARGTAAELLPPEASAEQVDALGEDLELQIWNAISGGAVLAAVLIPEPQTGSLAVLRARPLDLPDGAATGADVLDAAERLLSGPETEDLARPAETDRVRLPAGPACRARLLRAVPVPDEPAVLIETVVHVVVSEEPEPEAAEVRLDWLAVTLGDELAELADEVAAGFRW
jgi:hypothetical protein